MKKTVKRVLLLAGFPLLALTSGCSVLTGFSNAYTDFGCRGVDGEPSCKAISSVYEEQKYQWEVQSEFNQAASGAPVESKGGFQKIANPSEAFDQRLPTSPFRTAEVISRVWLPPKVSGNAVITDWHYSYVRLHDSRWTDNATNKLIESKGKYRTVTQIASDREDPQEEQKAKLKTLPAFGFGNPTPTPL